MNTLPGQLKRSNVCPICSGAMEQVFSFPQLPITEKYEPHTAGYEPRGLVDQSFLFCAGCSHGKLETVIPPEELYSSGYMTKTASSVGASHSIFSFYDFINRHLRKSNYDTVIDIGANDSSLLHLFHGKRRVAVDPNASGSAELVREYIEKADLSQYAKDRKLIVSSHTLEHVEDPNAFLKKIMGIVHHGDAVALQFPSLDCLVRDARVDQIHHQHVQYFSLMATSLLCARHGLEIVAWDFDLSHYGTLRVIARRGLEELKGAPITKDSILSAGETFFDSMDVFHESIERLREPVGYGASLMLPVLDYHAKLDRLGVVCEEDSAKHGLRYINCNKKIVPPTQVKGGEFVVTAFNTRLAVRKIAAKLMEGGAKAVVVPFNTL